jgi:hypothetical protein
VKVIVVELSGFRTGWAGSSMIVRDIPEAYAATGGAMNTGYGRAPTVVQATPCGRPRS